jgi:hypothetical protein
MTKKKKSPLAVKTTRGERAKIIALLVEQEDTDSRGLLFKEVADNLRGNTQYFTANLFSQLALVYGLPK